MILELSTFRYPCTETDVRCANPNTSFPASLVGLDLTDFGFTWVTPTPPPACNRLAETIVEQAPQNTDGEYQQTWAIRPLGVDVCIANAQRIVQQHMDDKARERNYDGILSACSYATSSNPEFSGEGQACIAWRDAVWAACYQIMTNVQDGTHEMPTPKSLIAELPEMTWPS